MSNKGQTLQDPFLNTLRKDHVPVSIYLVNGIKLQGQIESFDQYVVLLRNTVTQMVYKHAISTVVPARAVNFQVEVPLNKPAPAALPFIARLTVHVGGHFVARTKFPFQGNTGAAVAPWFGFGLQNGACMRALIISVDLGDPDFLAHAEEFAMLAKGAGAEIVGTLTARRDRPDAKFFIGSGKADEGVGMAQALLADIVLFDQPLSPAQQRNLERLFNLRVVDRVALILDIFALRAKSHEGKLQVELAQLQHLATRLTRMWSHLERQRGGIGMRGPGESQLEMDRRMIGAKVWCCASAWTRSSASAQRRA